MRHFNFIARTLPTVLSLSAVLSSMTWAQTAPQRVTAAAAPAVASGKASVLISELRASGPGGDEDAFVELANMSEAAVAIGGWSLRCQSADGQEFAVSIPTGVSLPARGHFLFAGRAYSLKSVALADAIIGRAFANGVQLRDAAGRTVDAVGSSAAKASFREGEGLNTAAFSRQKEQFSCVRRVAAGRLRDTDDNRRDFVIVSVTGQLGTGQLGAGVARLGAPGPENLHSLPLHLSTSAPQLTAQKTANQSDNPANTTPAPLTAEFHRPPLRNHDDTGAGRAFGTLTLRCRLVNITDQPITRLKFRIDGITNLPKNQLNAETSAETADLRLLPVEKSPEKARKSVTTNATDAEKTPAEKSLAEQAPAATARRWEAVLDEPPAQPLGGGFNSSVTVTLPSGGLAPGAAGDVEYVMGVERRGRYRVVFDSEHFRLTFDGDTEDVVRNAPNLQGGLPNFNNGPSRTTIATGTSSPTAGSNGSPTTTSGAGTTAKNEPEAKTLLLSASIVLSGNTEDELGGPEDVSRSTLNISAFRLQGETLLLRFDGALNPESALNTELFTVQVNDQDVDIDGLRYDVGSMTIALTLAPGTLRRGDSITVMWENLKDLKGLPTNGQIGPAKVP